MNTQENNKIIAEFMGYKLANCSNGQAWESPHKLAKDDVFKIHGRLWRKEDSYYEWNESWNWIMPVVAKCTKEGYGDFEEPLTQKWEELFEPMESAFLGNHIGEVYETVVKFIEWFNENKED